VGVFKGIRYGVHQRPVLIKPRRIKSLNKIFCQPKKNPSKKEGFMINLSQTDVWL
jgi:hypothetical protein